MTKKDYELIASVIAAHVKDLHGVKNDPRWKDGGQQTLSNVASELATKMAQQNPQFSKNRFMKACGYFA